MQPSTPRRKNTSFAGDVFKLVTGTAAAQALGILTAPILTRLYGPEAFGVLALFISISTIIGQISCWLYELSIMLPERDEEAANLFSLSIGLVIVTSSITAPFFWFGKSTIAILLKAPAIEPYLPLVPPTILFSGVFLALNYWNSRTKNFGRLSLANFLKSLLVVVCQLGAGVAGYTAGGLGLIGANFTGTAVSSVVLGSTVWNEDSKFLRGNVSWDAIKSGFRRYAKFPLYNTWVTLLNTISWQLPVLMLGVFFSPQIVGYYALGYRLISIPMNLIGNSIRQVFFQRASEAKAKGEISHVMESSFYYLVFLSFLPICVLFLTGKDIFQVFFGANWTESGVYVQILAIWLFAWFISSPVSTIFSVVEKQEFSLRIQILVFGSRIFSLYLGGIIGEPRAALALFSITGFFVYGYICILALNVSDASLITSLHKVIDASIFYIPAVVIILAIKYISSSSMLVIIASSILMIVYAYFVKKKLSSEGIILN